ncbi:GIY-YIG nuclease family protein [uncultured Winogradskyella sp.]|uniref:GIY-YIG nuclease family protein n=1 Tax=uncultured Winogradskyella sp. TaxID=395353 RepID=UPI0026032851|nr:GIY-YIG nuclease family protein [uncultured Winogradskyella sp.]
MYVYVIKCANFYKIGYSKNPEARRKTIQTHNPLDVRICATLKTDNAQEYERWLHKYYLSRRSRGEWFELKHDDLMDLKIECGFNFKMDISKIQDTDTLDNKEYKDATKNIRAINNEFESLREYYEDMLDADSDSGAFLKSTLIKYGFKYCKEAIDVMIDRSYSYNQLPIKFKSIAKSCWMRENDTKGYFINRLKGLFWGKFGRNFNDNELHALGTIFIRVTSGNTEDDISWVDSFLKKLNSMSYNTDSNGLIEEINALC